MRRAVEVTNAVADDGVPVVDQTLGDSLQKHLYRSVEEEEEVPVTDLDHQVGPFPAGSVEEEVPVRVADIGLELELHDVAMVVP